MLKFKKDAYERQRKRMVETQLVPRGIRQQKLLDAMLAVPRHIFVDEAFYSQAYGDFPLPIGFDQTISQPYMVALMTEALELTGKERVLEIGTGSGYQTAVLAMLAEKVYTVERLSALAERAGKTLDTLLCSNVVRRVGDGSCGWPDEAPFDAILVTAGSPEVPKALVEQLSVGGRLVIPVGGEMNQQLVRITKNEGGFTRDNLGYCRFVKLIGKYGWFAQGA